MCSLVQLFYFVVLLLCLDVIKLQLVEAGLVECLLEVVAQTVDGEREEDIAQLKTASDLMVLLLLGGKLCSGYINTYSALELCLILYVWMGMNMIKSMFIRIMLG